MNTYKFIIGYIVVSTALMVFLNKLNMEGVDETLAPPPPEETNEDSGMEAETVTMEEEPPIVQGEGGEGGGMGSMVDKAMEMAGKGFDLFVQIATLVLLVMIFMKVRSPSLS